jgi:hypothetical protein
MDRMMVMVRVVTGDEHDPLRLSDGRGFCQRRPWPGSVAVRLSDER